MNDFVVKNGLQLGGSVKGSVGTVTGNATLDLSTGSAFEVVPTADVTFAFSNPPAAGNAQSFSVALTGVDIGTPYDLANASYDSVSFNVGAQDASPVGVSFKTDGTKMYIMDQSGDDISEYSLSTAWNVSTASYSQNFSVAAQEITPNDLFFKPDGTKVYVVGADGNDVNEYNLSTAWDISTASFIQNFSVAAQETAPQSVSFKADGTKMYVLGANSGLVLEYNLSVAWDISTSSYFQGFNVVAREAILKGLFFKPDGTRMYVIGFANDDVDEYSLSTAWDVSTASYIRSFIVAAQDSLPFGLFFKPDGTKMYIAGLSNTSVFQYSTGTAPAPATITYPASVKWPSGTTPTAPADGETDLLTFYTDDGGTTYYGIQRGDNMAPVPPDPMVLIYNTALSAGTTVVLPLAGTVDVTVDWGDGYVETFTTSGDKTHTYATEGTYTVEMTGTLTGFGSSSSTNKNKLTRVTSWGDLEFTLTSLVNGFRNCSNLTEVPTTLPSGVTTMSAMFLSATAFNQNIGSWDVSNVTDMNNMFRSASVFNQNIGSWNVSNVTNMGSMFLSATAFNNGGSADINNWVPSSVTNMTSMFKGASAMTFPLGSWQTNLAGQPSNFSASANATFVGFRGTADFPLLADTVTRINT